MTTAPPRRPARKQSARKGPPGVVSAAPRLRAKAKQERWDRRLRWLRRTGVVLLALAPLVAAGWVLLASGLLAVQKVSITGTGRLSRAEVQRVVDVPLGTPLAKVDIAAVEARLKRLPPVAEATVSRDWPHGLRVVIVERVVVVAERQGTSWVLRDRTGAEVATSATVPRGVYALVSRSPASTAAALGVMQELPPGLRGLLRSVQATSPEQVLLRLTDGRQVLWGGDSDNAVKAAAVWALLKMPGSYFDVSAKGVATRR
ncbi:MAG: Polypeptide-transport-associated domain protein FtsQ-type [Frankiales bacterium]|nr:Polypeptide-transport-associated domain protein FtsQ-type [Frankiales bacterium]